MKQYNHHYYNKNLQKFARQLRTETVSRAEKNLWKHLLSRKQTGERFLRQRSILYFIVDFFAPKLNLIIEIDGNSHFDKGDYDRMRQDKLEDLGYTIIRFSEGDVINNFSEVSTQIYHVIESLKDEG